MKKYMLLLTAFAITFVGGYALSTLMHQESVQEKSEGRVTGIGGVFFKCTNPQQTRDWYNKHLGLNTDQYGTTFEWRQASDSTLRGFTQWSPFSMKTKYFAPSEKDFMINYRVDNLEALVSKLRQDSISIVDSIETYDYGKFVHIMDCDGNKLELWEPKDDEYDKVLGVRTR
jgi:predicted enzyme related to lactoylglutathione lyase